MTMDMAEQKSSSVAFEHERYSYKPLDSSEFQIRVFTLYPSDEFDAPIEGQMNVVALSSSPEYEALSYVWGSEAKPCTISVDGSSLAVTENLDVALRYQRRHQPRNLWVDAICINQSDTVERSTQVKHMRDIFQSAKRVRMWLGPGDQYTDVFMKLLIDCNDDEIVLREIYDDTEGNLLTGLSRLLKKPWWYRVWTVQEALVQGWGGGVGCGSYWMFWNYFLYKIIIILERLLPLALQYFPMEFTELTTLMMLDKNREIIQDGTELTFFDMLICASTREATDPRDRVFALAGLVSDSAVKQVIEPDYSVDISTVYQRGTIALFHEGSAIEPLATAPRKRRQLPTWCIDFAHRESFFLLRLHHHFPGMDTYLDGGGYSASDQHHLSILRHDANAGELGIEGCVVGKVDKIMPCHIPICVPDGRRIDSKELATFLETVQSIISVVPRNEHHGGQSNQYGKTTISPKTLLEILAAEKLDRGKVELELADLSKQIDAEVWAKLENDEQPGDDSVSWLQALLTYLGSESGKQICWAYNTPESLPTCTCPSESSHVFLELLQMMLGRVPEDATVFSTGKNYIGRAHSMIEKGDILCILFGCRLPVVLRPIGTKYEFVTAAYVYGIVEGQFVADEAALKKEVFCLI